MKYIIWENENAAQEGDTRHPRCNVTETRQEANELCKKIWGLDFWLDDNGNGFTPPQMSGWEIEVID